MTDEIIWRGPESLRPLLVPLEAVSPHPRNPKDHDLGAIAASLARFGQQSPIVVQRSTGWIIAGNGRWLAIPSVAELERVLGFGPAVPWTHVAVVWSDLEPGAAEAYAVGDNRTHDLGGYDDAALLSLLVELSKADQLLGTGYDGDDVDELLRSMTPYVPEDVPSRSEPMIGSEVRIEIRCSRAFLETNRETIESWSSLAGVEVSIA